jgi:hypothetical protein
MQIQDPQALVFGILGFLYGVAKICWPRLLRKDDPDPKSRLLSRCLSGPVWVILGITLIVCRGLGLAHNWGVVVGWAVAVYFCVVGLFGVSFLIWGSFTDKRRK